MAMMKNNKSKSPTDVKVKKQKVSVIKKLKVVLSKEHREEVKTAKKVETLKYKVFLSEQLPILQEEKLARKVSKQLTAFETKEAKKLFALEKKTLSQEDLFTFSFADEKAKLEKKMYWDKRAAKQKVLLSLGLVDPKTFHRVGEMTEEATTKVAEAEKAVEDAFNATCAEAREKFNAKNPELSAEELAANKKALEEAEASYKASADELKTKLEAATATKLEAFKAKNEVKAKSYQEKLAAAEEHMEKIIQAGVEKNGEYTLPEDTILRLENLSMHFGGLKAVDNLSVDIKEGEIFGLIGPNGAGKTTVFNCITQFYKPTLGNVWFKSSTGRVLRLNDYAVHNVIKLGIVRTFQNVELIPELTVYQNLLIAAHTQYKTGLFSHFINTATVKREEEIIGKKALKVLEYLELTSLKDNFPVGLPYGILKRIELARTLMADARLIILDEPAAGLNDKETEDLAVVIKKIAKEFNATIFLVEHDMGLVMDICDHICAISFGKKLSYGTPEEIQEDPVVQEAYLGSEG